MLRHIQNFNYSIFQSLYSIMDKQSKLGKRTGSALPWLTRKFDKIFRMRILILPLKKIFEGAKGDLLGFKFSFYQLNKFVQTSLLLRVSESISSVRRIKLRQYVKINANHFTIFFPVFRPSSQEKWMKRKCLINVCLWLTHCKIYSIKSR